MYVSKLATVRGITEKYMTVEQIQQLRAMSEQEVVKHYWNKLRLKEINLSQYDKAIEYWKSLQNTEETKPSLPMDVHQPSADSTEGDMGKMLVAQFGGTIVEEETEGKKLSQKARLLKLLQDMQWHNVNEIQKVVYGAEHLGSARVAARIADLKKDGWKIEGQDVTATLYEYRLKLEQFKLV